MGDHLQFVVDLSTKAATIPALLFGHNLEHTRSAVWQGLSAELLRNRKFYGKSQRNGVALDWYAIGPKTAHWELEAQDTYTTHYNPEDHRRRNEVLCQRIRSLADHDVCGIGQDRLVLCAGTDYRCRIALRADRAVPVWVRITSSDRSRLFGQACFEVGPQGWQEFAFTFHAAEGCNCARLEVTFEVAANLYVGAVSLAPEDTFLGMRRDVIALLKEIGCTLLRWPGGNFAGDYRWQDGLLPVDRRAPLASFMEMETLPHTRGFDCNEIGIDEFIALCREIGAEPFLTINPAWESPELSAAWVEYCNGDLHTKWGSLRAERGHPEPYAVKYWSLGNELGYGHMEGPNVPAEYAKTIRPYVAAMRAVDPSIVLVSSGLWSKDSWFTDCLANLGDVIDLISHHHYTRQIKDYAGPLADEEFRRVATTPAEVFQRVKDIRAKIDANAPKGRTIGISFDEWNVWYAWYRVPGVVEGIHNASMLNMFCREAARMGITLGCFFQPVNEGIIMVEPGRAYLPAGGQVFPLYKAHYGNTLLELAAQDGLADVDVTASLDEQTKTVVLTLVNRSPKEQHDTHIKIQGQPIGEVEAILLSAPDFQPGTAFTATAPAVTRQGSDELSITLPKHSVARLSVHLTA